MRRNDLHLLRPITRKRKVEKILSNSDAVYVLYADGTWRKKMLEDIERIIVETEEGEEIATIINDDKIDESIIVADGYTVRIKPKAN